MGTTSYHFLKLKSLEQQAELLGLRLTTRTDGWKNDSDYLALCTYEEHLPVYTRDIALAMGTAEELLQFLHGWQKAREYLHCLGVATEETVRRKEQDYRNRELARAIKGTKTQHVTV